MAFSVSDYEDLIRLLREHPEWRAELRREILADEFLQLPALVRENSEDIRALREVVAQNSRDILQNSRDIQELKEVVAQNSRDIVQNSRDIQELKDVVAQNSRDIVQNSRDIRELKEVVAENSRDIQELKQAVDRLVARIDALVDEMARQRDHIGELRGDVLESWYRNHAGVLAHALALREPRVVLVDDLPALDAAEEDGRITPKQAESLRYLDVLISGREGRGDAARDVLLAVEVSWTIDVGDVTRVAERARALRAAGYHTRALVAGKGIGPRAAQAAELEDVAVHLDFRPVPSEEEAS